MGIRNFYRFIEKYCPDIVERKRLSDYSGKVLGVDANFLLYKFLEQNVLFLCNNFINETNNYEMFYLKLINIISYVYCFDVKLIFVFDGKVPDIKKNTVFDRKMEREISRNKLEEVLEDLEEYDTSDSEDLFESFIKECNREDNLIISKEDLIKKRKKLLLETIYLDGALIKAVKELLTYCGVPYLDAPYEADSQLAYMSKNNLIDGIISNDYDILTFGGKDLILDFFMNMKIDPKKEIISINLDRLLKRIKLNYNNFVELCILMGSDYSDKPNYTFEHLYDLFLKHRSYENIKDLLELPNNLNMENIKKYFFDSYSITYEPNNLKNTYKFYNYNLDQISMFLNSRKNLLLDDIRIGKFMNSIKKSELKKK
jgi:flap endonuclease-1